MGAARRSLRAMIFASAACLAFGLIGALPAESSGQCAGSPSQRGLAQCCGGGSCTQAMRESGTARVRGRHAAQHQEPTAKPLRRATASGPAGSDIMRPAVNETNGQLEHTGKSESTIKPELVRTVRASRKRGATDRSGRTGHRNPSRPPLGRGSTRFLAPRPVREGQTSSEAPFSPSLPSASSLPARPPVTIAPRPVPRTYLRDRTGPRHRAYPQRPCRHSPRPAGPWWLPQTGCITTGCGRRGLSSNLVCHVSGLRNERRFALAGIPDAHRTTQRDTRS